MNSPALVVSAEGSVELTDEWVRALSPLDSRVYRALAQVMSTERRLTLRELAISLDISQSALVKSLKSLSSVGLLKGLSVE